MLSSHISCGMGIWSPPMVLRNPSLMDYLLRLRYPQGSFFKYGPHPSSFFYLMVGPHFLLSTPQKGGRFESHICEDEENWTLVWWKYLLLS